MERMTVMNFDKELGWWPVYAIAIMALALWLYVIVDTVPHWWE